MDPVEAPSDLYRALTANRTGYDGVLFDVQLQVISTGALVWAQSFSDQAQAESFHEELETDLKQLALPEFRSKYSVPSNS